MARETQTRRRTIMEVALLLWLALVLGALSFVGRQPDSRLSASVQFLNTGLDLFFTSPEPGDVRNVNINSIVEGRRVLMPLVYAGLRGLTGLPSEYVFSLLRLISIVAALVAFRWFLGLHFDGVWSLVGVLLMVATLPLTFLTGHEVLTDFPELMLFSLALRSLAQDRLAPFCLFLFLGTVNRETAGLLCLVAVLVKGVSGVRARPAWLVLPPVVWAIPLVYLWTNVPYPQAPGELWPKMLLRNLAGLQHFTDNLNPYNNFLFPLYLLGLLWPLALWGWTRTSPTLRRPVVAGMVFLVVCFNLGGFHEIRQQICLFALVLPAGLSALRRLWLGIETNPVAPTEQ